MHAKGTWSVTEDDLSFYIETENWIVATAHKWNDNSKTDAYLIAAAPDLLAACKAIVEGYNDHYRIQYCKPWEQAVYQTAKNAIAKAEGE